MREPLRKPGAPKYIGRISGDMSRSRDRTVKQGARGRTGGSGDARIGGSSSRPAQWFRTIRDVKAAPSSLVGRTAINSRGFCRGAPEKPGRARCVLVRFLWRLATILTRRICSLKSLVCRREPSAPHEPPARSKRERQERPLAFPLRRRPPPPQRASLPNAPPTSNLFCQFCVVVKMRRGGEKAAQKHATKTARHRRDIHPNYHGPSQSQTRPLHAPAGGSSPGCGAHPPPA